MERREVVLLLRNGEFSKRPNKSFPESIAGKVRYVGFPPVLDGVFGEFGG